MAEELNNIQKINNKKKKSNMSLKDIDKLYQESITARNLIIGQYNDIALSTMPYTDMWDADTGTITKKANKIDSTIIASWKDMGSFIMATMLGQGGWAEAEMDRKQYDLLKGQSEKFESILGKDFEDAMTRLSTDSKRTFEIMVSSNYMKAVAKSLVEAMNLGTGAFKMLDTNDNMNPVRYKHIPIARVSFTEDAYGNPSHTFITHKAMKKEHIETLFGKTPPGDKEKYDLIEANVLKESDGVFHKTVYVAGTQDVVYSDKLNYNDTIIFRWDTSQHSVYGTGIGFELVDDFDRLKKYKELQRASAELNVFPPLGFNGAIETMNKLNYSMGTINFLGENQDIGQVSPLNIGSNYLSLENEINKTELAIRNAYISQPIGDYTDRNQTTATEVQERMTIFRNRMSGAYESLSTELLKPSFMNTFKMLGSKGIFEFDVELYELIKLKYTNAMSKSADVETANKVINYKQMAVELFPNEEQFVISSVETLTGLGQLMGVPREFYASKEKAKSNVEEYQAKLVQQPGQGVPLPGGGTQ